MYPTILYNVLFSNKQQEEVEQLQVMEELPRNSLLSIPLKVPDKLVWSPALLHYIKNSYAEDASKYEKDCQLIDALREHSLNQSTHATYALDDLSM